MKNKTIDLNNHLFEVLERLNDDDLKDEELEKEIKRSTAIVGVADAIIANTEVALKATKLQLEYRSTFAEDIELPQMLEMKHEK